MCTPIIRTQNSLPVLDSPSDTPGTKLESLIYRPYPATHGAYSKSKWVAECLLARATIQCGSIHQLYLTAPGLLLDARPSCDDPSCDTTPCRFEEWVMEYQRVVPRRYTFISPPKCQRCAHISDGAKYLLELVPVLVMTLSSV